MAVSKQQRQAYIYAAVAVFFWSTVASAFKISLRHVTPLELLFWASSMSALGLFGALLFSGGLREIRAWRGRDYLRSALLGFLNPFLYYVILLKAYDLLLAQEAQPLNQVWPITMALLSVPLLGQRLRLATLPACLIGFLGVLTISTRGDVLGFRFSSPLGASLAVGSSVIWALFWILNVRDTREEVSKLFANCVFGALFAAIAIAAWTGFSAPPTAGLLGAAYVGAFEMGLTFVLWLKALKLSETTTRVSILVYACPFLSLIFIHLTVGETIHPSTIVGLVLIIAGILVQHRWG